MILGLSGKIGSGKDYLASHRFSKEHKNVLILAFADFLKIEYGIQNNVSYERLFVNKDAKSRIGLQETSGYYKEKYGNDYYINALDLFIKIHKQPFINVIKNFLGFLRKPDFYIWKKPIIKTKTQEKQITKIIKTVPAKKKIKLKAKKKLQELGWRVEIQK